ncbi:Golgi-associated plant pathogenesis-related protein 1 [Frankliniella fusca]|uniref:Golgi-associated plant pathogenesis-related protein 1 n=1 Tax=Frankliniella fusca TaxID=407009 RepID=A0AAE1HW72_9NEOP|nr:Golgi-associated plant pathogenesis-related protein 1 [Frankliniella fusca]
MAPDGQIVQKMKSEQARMHWKSKCTNVIHLQMMLVRPVALVSEGHEADTDWHESEFISECLCWHNVYRQRHGVRDLLMSAELCDMAQTWANHLAHTNSFMYKPGETLVGQNLYCRLPNTAATEVTGQEVSAYWYSACKQYNYGKEPDVLHANVNAGHFTQLVWAGSREIGVGKARSRQGKTVVVAMYRPPGNVSGLFQENVLLPAPVCGDLELAASLSDSSSSYSAYRAPQLSVAPPSPDDSPPPERRQDATTTAATVHPAKQLLDPRALLQPLSAPREPSPRAGTARQRARVREEMEALLRQADEILPELDEDGEGQDGLGPGDEDASDEAVAKLLAARRLRLPTVERVRVYGNRMVLEPVVSRPRSGTRTGGGGILGFLRRFK